MKTAILCLILSSSICTGLLSLQAQSRLIIDHPDAFTWGWWWNLSEGEISEATLVLEPKGAFLQCEMTLVFSAEHVPVWGSDDSLEVEYFFDLPKGSIVYDSWLWIENYISYGIIMDKDSATFIYEEIVDRKTDPSILKTSWYNNYELRIYPITPDGPRKVKISVLLPTEWSKDYVMSTIPLEGIFSFFSGDDVQLILKQDSVFQNPIILERPDWNLNLQHSPLYGDHVELLLDGQSPNDNLTLAYGSPIGPGEDSYASFVSTATDSGFYQLAILPEASFPTAPPSKVLILLDHEEANANDVREFVKEIAKRELSPTDSFNFMLNTPNGIASASPNWIPATGVFLDAILDPGLLPLSPHSQLLSLLQEGLEFMDDHNNQGSIVLISSNDQYFNQYWRMLYDSLTVNEEIPVPFHIANYQKYGYDYYWDSEICGNRCGNEYVYQQIAEHSGGSVFNLRLDHESMYLLISHAFLMASGQLDSISVYTNVGFDPHRVSCFPQRPPLRRAYLEVGKYTGAFPLQGYLTAEYQQIGVQTFFDIDQSKMFLADTMLIKSWTGAGRFRNGRKVPLVQHLFRRSWI